jgi:hypothetical protein
MVCITAAFVALRWDSVSSPRSPYVGDWIDEGEPRVVFTLDKEGRCWTNSISGIDMTTSFPDWLWSVQATRRLSFRPGIENPASDLPEFRCLTVSFSHGLDLDPEFVVNDWQADSLVLTNVKTRSKTHWRRVSP